MASVGREGLGLEEPTETMASVGREGLGLEEPTETMASVGREVQGGNGVSVNNDTMCVQHKALSKFTHEHHLPHQNPLSCIVCG